MIPPAWAQQMLPEISIDYADGVSETQAFAETIVQPCNNTARGGLPVQIRASRPANGVTVNTMAFTVSGYDRLRDHGVPPYVDPSAQNGGPVVYRPSGAATYTGNSTGWFRLNQFSGGRGSPCFPNDVLITDDTVIEVVLMPGNGYTINPDMRSVRLTVEDDSEEACDNLEEIGRRAMSSNAPLLYKVRNGNLNDTCICATEAQVDKYRLKPELMCDDSPWPGSGS